MSEVDAAVRAGPRRWLVTGGAGFIGSHLVERLLRLDREVVVLDNLATGRRANLDEVRALVGPRAANLQFVEGDLRDPAACREVVRGVGVVLHQAALGSVPRSMVDPATTCAVNVGGFVTLLEAARAERVGTVVFASSSSVYGGTAALPTVEEAPLDPKSPYAASKASGELIARAWTAAYGLPTVGLRYFNVCGARQSPDGPYALVVPRFIAELRGGVRPTLHGDGLTSRDFCPVANVVEANLLAAVGGPVAHGRVYNVGNGGSTTVRALFEAIRAGLVARGVDCGAIEPATGPVRAGDARHSLADLTAIRRDLGYAPVATLDQALADAMDHALGAGRARPA